MYVLYRDGKGPTFGKGGHRSVHSATGSNITGTAWPTLLQIEFSGGCAQQVHVCCSPKRYEYAMQITKANAVQVDIVPQKRSGKLTAHSESPIICNSLVLWARGSGVSCIGTRSYAQTAIGQTWGSYCVELRNALQVLTAALEA